jgi:hypothetical protein
MYAVGPLQSQGDGHLVEIRGAVVPGGIAGRYEHLGGGCIVAAQLQRLGQEFHRLEAAALALEFELVCFGQRQCTAQRVVAGCIEPARDRDELWRRLDVLQAGACRTQQVAHYL